LKKRKLFIMNRYSENYRQNLCMSVGVMNDLKVKLRNLHVSHTGIVRGTEIICGGVYTGIRKDTDEVNRRDV